MVDLAAKRRQDNIPQVTDGSDEKAEVILVDEEGPFADRSRCNSFYVITVSFRLKLNLS